MMDAIEAGRELRRRVASFRPGPRLRSRIRFNLPMERNELIQLLDSNRSNAAAAMIRIQTTPTLDADQMVDLFQLVATKLPRLVNVEITCSYRPQPITVRALEHLLQSLKDRLETLRLGAYLTGTRAEYDAMLAQVSQLSSLKTLALSAFGANVTDMPPQESREMTRWVVDSFLRSVKGVETLENVRFCMSQPSMVPNSALEQLCRKTTTDDDNNNNNSSRRRQLDLSMYGVAVSLDLIRVICGPQSAVCALRLSDVRNTINEMAPGIAEGFRHNQSLRELSLRGADVSNQSWTTLLHALAESTSGCLRTLRLDANEITPPMYAALDKLATNCLKRLDISILPRLRANPTNNMGQILGQLCQHLLSQLGNTTNNQQQKPRMLSHLKVHLHGYISLVHGGGQNDAPTDEMRLGFRTQMNECLEETLETNCHLKEVRVVVSGKCLPLSDKASFMLAFNAAGRKDLVAQPDDRQRWVDMIVDESYNTSLVHYLLSLHPERLLPCIPNCELSERRRKRLRDFLVDQDDYGFLRRRSKRLKRMQDDAENW